GAGRQAYGSGGAEGETDTGVTSGLGRVVHLVRPVLVVAAGEEGAVGEQGGAVRMRVDVRRVRHVVSVPLEPTDEVDLPVEKVARTVVGIRPMERNLYRSSIPGDRARAEAV